MEVIVTGLMDKTTARTSYNSCQANLGSVGKHVNPFVEKEDGQFLEEVLQI